MRKVLALGCLIFLPILTWANSERVIKAVTQSVKGTTITRVALRPIPNSDSLQMTIFTTDGERSLILSRKHIQVALNTLNDPHLIGVTNAGFSKRFINSHPNLLRYAALPSTHTNHVPNAAAIVTTNVISANQQASR